MGEAYRRRRRRIRDDSAAASRRSVTVALVLLLCQAQGLLAPASHKPFNNDQASPQTRATRPMTHSHAISNHPRRSKNRIGVVGWTGEALRRGWNSATSSSTSRTGLRMMANPEGTQQLRDRDLEFMFYDEAQVGRPACRGARPLVLFHTQRLEGVVTPCYPAVIAVTSCRSRRLHLHILDTCSPVRPFG